MPATFIQDRPLTSLALAGAAVVGASSAVSAYGNSRGGIEDRANQAGMTGVRAALGTMALVGVGAVAFSHPGPLKKAGSYLTSQFDATRAQLSSRLKTALAGLPADAGIATRAGVTAKVYGTSGRLMAGAGGIAGLAIGASYGHPLLGAAIGAGAGMAIKGSMKAVKGWDTLSKIPGGRTAAVLAGSALLFGGIQAATPAQYQSVTYGVGDGANDRGESQSSPVRSRMKAMNASGKVVLGLNDLRHG